MVERVDPSYNVFAGRALKNGDVRWTRADRERDEMTHTLLTGGTLTVRELDMFYSDLADDVGARSVPCVTELRTPKFPMYVDVDLRVPVDRFEDDLVLPLVRTLVQAARRCYPRGDADEARCVVLGKDVAGTDQGGGMWKHGLHLHWPALVVDHFQALCLLECMLYRVQARDWTDVLGTNDLDWRDILDGRVYGQGCGLRLPFAPKAKKCSCVKPPETISCDRCNKHNKCHVIDTNVYRLRMVLCMDGTLDEERAAHLAGHPARLLRACSVRCEAARPLAPGFVRPADVPADVLSNRTGKGRQPKNDGTTVGGAVGAKFSSKGVEVTDARVVSAVRDIVTAHSARYREAGLRVYRTETAYRVQLTGEGAKYCLNKQDFHTSSKVYADITLVGRNGEYASRMRCYCRKARIGVMGKPCGQFTSLPKNLCGDHKRLLFDTSVFEPRVASSSSAGSTSTRHPAQMKIKMTRVGQDAEDERAAQRARLRAAAEDDA